MARGDLLKKLFLSYLKRNDDSFRSAALEIIAEEQKKNHLLLANELQRILSNGSRNPMLTEIYQDLSTLPKDRERQAILVEVRKPDRYLPDIILSENKFKDIQGILEEFRKGEILHSHGVKPRTKLLLCGPPGCGKTLLAEVIATELSLPMLYTRFDTIVSSYLGETSANLRKVFDYASRGTWVLFFDEFDAIGKSRDDLTEHGELKRVINSFLQLLDGFHSDSLVIAATNHEYLLDVALWRRFDEILYMERPSIPDIKLLISRKLGSIPHPRLKPDSFVQKLKGLSHAEIERICYDAIRFSVLRDLPEITPELFQECIQRELKRLGYIRVAKKPDTNSIEKPQ